MEIRHIDFSEFHPLDHSLIKCRGYPGGRRRHLEFSWDFIWKDRVRGQTVCRVGFHDFQVWHKASPGPTFGQPVVHDEIERVVCGGCGREADPVQRAEALVEDRERARRAQRKA